MKKILVLLFLFLCGTVSGEVFNAGEVTTFVSPDSSYSQIAVFIDGAASSLYVNVYTFDSPLIADKIVEAHERGVDVVVLVDGSPVGGISEGEWTALNNMSGSGIPVYLWDDADLGFNHAKYVVRDNASVLVATENLGTTGFPKPGTSGNRGWGAIVAGESAAYFAELFFEDVESGKQVNFTGESPLVFYPEAGGYQSQFEPEVFHGNFTAVPVVAPENAVDAILDLIDSATSSLYVEEFYVYKYWGSKKKGYVPNPFLEASIEAARQGVEVKILLDSTWYNIEEDDPTSNIRTVQYVNNIAKEEGLNLEARLVDLDSTGFKKLHVKGVVVDSNAVFISSVNWNEHSPTKNREVGIIIYGEPAEYFSDVFISDWEQKGGQEEEHERDYGMVLLVIPLGLAAILLYLKRRR
ncbi:MAG: phospholipase D-like domain-containing protein [Candidatus Hydrothermarchaeaceae archaeon]